jgi:hypothetical protein
MKRVFVLGRCNRRASALMVLRSLRAPFVGPFVLCGVASARLRQYGLMIEPNE